MHMHSSSEPWLNSLWSRGLALLGVAVAVIMLLGLTACSVTKSGEGENKKVNIETPMGSLKVNTQVDPKDTGLEVYPGARRAPDEAHDHSGANVNIDSSLFGVKVVALKYESDDPPEKLLDFYRKQLKPFGQITECHGNIDFRAPHGEQQVHCNESGDRKQVQLAVGNENRHRLVSVKPRDKGSEFALVHVQTRGEKGTL